MPSSRTRSTRTGRRVTLGAKVERDTHAGWGPADRARDVDRRARSSTSLGSRLAQPAHSLTRRRVGPLQLHISCRTGGLPVVGAIGTRTSNQNRSSPLRLVIGSRRVDRQHRRDRVVATTTSSDERNAAAADGAHAGDADLFIPAQFGNLLEATTTGVEVVGRWAVASWWRLEGGYSTFRLTPHLSAQSRDVAAASFDGNAPRAQWQARSAFSIGSRVQADAMLFHTGASPRRIEAICARICGGGQGTGTCPRRWWGRISSIRSMPNMAAMGRSSPRRRFRGAPSFRCDGGSR